MFSRHKHILVFFGILGVLLVPVGDIMTIQGRFAKGDDSSIYLVDFDESDYDLYIDGYYPSDYTYDDFRRDSIEGMVSHYVATDNNNFSAVVDTIENDVLQNGWSVIKDFFVNSWIDLKSGVVTVERGFTDDFKHELDSRFMSSGSYNPPSTSVGSGWVHLAPYVYNGWYIWATNPGSNAFYDAWVAGVGTLGSATTGFCICTVQNNNFVMRYKQGSATLPSNSLGTFSAVENITGNSYKYGNQSLQLGLTASYSSVATAVADFYGNGTSAGDWNGVGYYSNTPADYSINLPALPAIDWQSISNNNKNTYGVDFPDVDLTVDFQLPDSYYPQTVTYDTPYWLYNTDSTPVDWANVSFDDVTLPEVQLSDGDGSFFQALFNTLPLAFVPILLGVILCYLIFLML